MCADRRRAILRDFLNGNPVADIAAQHGISKRYVSLLASKAGLSRRRGRPTSLLVLSMNPEQFSRYSSWRRHYGLEIAKSMIATEILDGKK